MEENSYFIIVYVKVADTKKQTNKHRKNWPRQAWIISKERVHYIKHNRKLIHKFNFHTLVMNSQTLKLKITKVENSINLLEHNDAHLESQYSRSRKSLGFRPV